MNHHDVNDKNIDKIIGAVKSSWSQDTSSRPDQWSSKNPARGQCVPSSLVIQKLLGGELIRYKAVYEGVAEKHFANLIGNKIIDSARSQYPDDFVLLQYPQEPSQNLSFRDKLLGDPGTKARYEIMLAHVEKLLNIK
jgi:hypothetical protein